MDLQLLIVILISAVLTLPASAINAILADHNNLVYKQCPNKTSSEHTLAHSSILPSLFKQFLIQSSHSKFYKTTIANDDDTDPISGRFQCRNDLSQSDCRNCIKNFPMLSKKFCGLNIPARIHLSGCYVHYQPDGVETSPVQVLHKTCSNYRIKNSRFKEVKDETFAEVESGVLSGSGFYETTTYDSFHVMAQCEENLGKCDCGECISNAIEIAEKECKYDISGEVYLDSCFFSYAFHGDQFGGYSYKDDDKGKEGGAKKLIAVVLGVLIAMSMVIACCYFMRSYGKKDDW